MSLANAAFAPSTSQFGLYASSLKQMWVGLNFICGSLVQSRITTNIVVISEPIAVVYFFGAFLQN